jgi:hypothetical protein
MIEFSGGTDSSATSIWCKHYFPDSEIELYFTEKDVSAKVVHDAGMPIWEGCSYGLQRTACRICPGQRKVAYAAMRANFPQTWAELLELETRFRPGCWQDPKGNGKGSLDNMANHGELAFKEGNCMRF